MKHCFDDMRLTIRPTRTFLHVGGVCLGVFAIMRRDDFLQAQVHEVECEVFVETGPRGVIAIAIDDLVFEVRLVMTQLIFYIPQLGVELIVLYFPGCM